jgi:hypothetical protein
MRLRRGRRDQEEADQDQAKILKVSLYVFLRYKRYLCCWYCSPTYIGFESQSDILFICLFYCLFIFYVYYFIYLFIYLILFLFDPAESTDLHVCRAVCTLHGKEPFDPLRFHLFSLHL